VAISPQHFESRFRLPLIPYLLKLLNKLKLALFQLTPNSYAQLTSLALLFLGNKFRPPFPKLVKFLFSFKSAKDGLYYLASRPSQYKTILPQGKIKGKSNVGDYKSSWFFVSCPLLLSLKSPSFALTPGKGTLARLGLLLLFYLHALTSSFRCANFRGGRPSLSAEETEVLDNLVTAA